MTQTRRGALERPWRLAVLAALAAMGCRDGCCRRAQETVNPRPPDAELQRLVAERLATDFLTARTICGVDADGLDRVQVGAATREVLHWRVHVRGAARTRTTPPRLCEADLEFTFFHGRQRHSYLVAWYVGSVAVAGVQTAGVEFHRPLIGTGGHILTGGGRHH
jgi:hypothetical protein